MGCASSSTQDPSCPSKHADRERGQRHPEVIPPPLATSPTHQQHELPPARRSSVSLTSLMAPDPIDVNHESPMSPSLIATNPFLISPIYGESNDASPVTLGSDASPMSGKGRSGQRQENLFEKNRRLRAEAAAAASARAEHDDSDDDLADDEKKKFIATWRAHIVSPGAAEPVHVPSFDSPRVDLTSPSLSREISMNAVSAPRDRPQVPLGTPPKTSSIVHHTSTAPVEVEQEVRHEFVSHAYKTSRQNSLTTAASHSRLGGGSASVSPVPRLPRRLSATVPARMLAHQ